VVVVGAGELAEVCDPPPQPVAISATKTRTIESEICRLEIILSAKGGSSSNKQMCFCSGFMGGRTDQKFHPR